MWIKFVILLIAMIFCHIFDDYYLQGILASMKQKSWWKENYPDEIYEHDYIVALITHAFSWTCSIHIPLFIYSIWIGIPNYSWIAGICIFVFGVSVHALIDNKKANNKDINLCSDQLAHLFQILIIWWVYVVMCLWG